MVLYNIHYVCIIHLTPSTAAPTPLQPPPDPQLLLFLQTYQMAEIWYESGAYARTPLSLAPLAETGADAVMEAGVIMP